MAHKDPGLILDTDGIKSESNGEVIRARQVRIADGCLSVLRSLRPFHFSEETPPFLT